MQRAFRRRSTALPCWRGSSLAAGRLFATLCLLAVVGLSALGPSASAATAGGSGIWTLTGRLHSARFGHSATLLPSGQVLVAGGNDDVFIAGVGNFLSVASAELYDPATDIWTLTGRMTTARQYHTATLLPSGQVLVTGGQDCTTSGCGTNLASAELYNPATGTWMDTGSMIEARSGHTATLLPDGKVLIAGGCCDDQGNLLASAELYDPASGTFTATGAMNDPHIGHTATLLPSGKVLVAGGCCDADGNEAVAELYDPSSGVWTLTGSLNTGRDTHTATLLSSGKVLIAGGYSAGLPTASAELYDPGTGTFTSTGSLRVARAWHTATLLPNGQVLAAGGNITFSLAPTASTELYNPATGRWLLAAFMGRGRTQHTATLLPNGSVLVAGGEGSNLRHEVLASAELYVP